MKNWLNENWFKAGLLVIIIIFGTVYFYQGNKNKLNSTVITESQKDSKSIQDTVAPVNTETKNQEVKKPESTPTPIKKQPTQPKSYNESWLSEKSGIDGWAYDDNKGYNIVLTFMSVNNPDYTFTATSNSSIYGNPIYDVGAGCNGHCYQQGSFLWMKRDDAAGELRNKGINANSVYGFQFSSSGYAHTDPSIPKDDYILIKATYNGKEFNLPLESYLQRVCGVNENGIQCYSW
jgi:hypothetical protein